MMQQQMPIPTREVQPVTEKPQKRIKPEKQFTPEEIQEINEIRVEQRNIYYLQRFWTVGMVPYCLFIIFILLLNVNEFAGPREDYPIFFYASLMTTGALIVWATIALHKFAWDDEDTWLWERVNEKGKEKHKKYKSMKADEFGGLMKAVGMRGGKDEDK